MLGQKQPYRGDVPLESLPQQVQIISSENLNQLGKAEFQGALDMAGGVARQNSFGGLWDSFAIRGFAGDENLPSGYLINGFSDGRGYSGNRDTSNIETAVMAFAMYLPTKTFAAYKKRSGQAWVRYL
jgi:iron complex outermembrane receptor protein